MPTQHMPIQEWGPDRYIPLIINERLLELGLEGGQITKEQEYFLRKDEVVYVAGWWVVLSKRINVV